jgi:hypothetical protein
VIYQQSFTYTPGAAPAPIYSQPFAVQEERTNLSVEVYAPVDNSWLDVDFDLVDPTTKDSEDQNVEVSYYHGTDSDGSWHEGGTYSNGYFTGVTPGMYYLTMTPQADPNIKAPMGVNVSVVQGTRSPGMFWLAIVMLSMVPLYYLLRISNFEQRRWADSSETDN